MRKINTILFFALILAQGTASATSFFCAQENEVQHQGINCCLTNISQELCQEKINTLSQSTVNRVALVKQLIQQGTYPDGGYPNCHWNALYEQGVREAVEKMELLYPEVPKIIERDFTEIAESDLKYGDYVVVWFNARVRDYDEEKRRKIWADVGLEAGHSAVYVGDGMVFQKESANSVEFSIQSIPAMFEAYEKGFNSQPQLKQGAGFLKYYRRK